MTTRIAKTESETIIRCNSVNVHFLNDDFIDFENIIIRLYKKEHSQRYKRLSKRFKMIKRYDNTFCIVAIANFGIYTCVVHLKNIKKLMIDKSVIYSLDEI